MWGDKRKVGGGHIKKISPPPIVAPTCKLLPTPLQGSLDNQMLFNVKLESMSKMGNSMYDILVKVYDLVTTTHL